eukprot:gene36949-66316_t
MYAARGATHDTWRRAAQYGAPPAPPAGRGVAQFLMKQNDRSRKLSSLQVAGTQAGAAESSATHGRKAARARVGAEGPPAVRTASAVAAAAAEAR